MSYDNTSYLLKLRVADGMVHSLCSASLYSQICFAGFVIICRSNLSRPGGQGVSV